MNPLNYSRGLLAELDDATTMHDDKLAANVRAELTSIEGDVRAALAAILDGPEPDTSVPDGFARGELALMRDRLDVALGVAPTGRVARRNAAKPVAPEVRPAA